MNLRDQVALEANSTLVPLILSDPIQKLPLELGSRIFELHDWSWPSTYLRSPLVLGGVCQHWRKVAWTTPWLWNKCLFYLNPSTSKPSHNVEVRIELFKEYLERSGDLPLTIHVFANDQLAYEVADADLEPLVEAINSCRTRWSYLNLELPTSLWNQLTVGQDRPIPKRLRTLWFSPLFDFDDEDTPAGNLPQCFAQSLPYLRSLVMYRVNFSPGSGSSWSHLQTLNVTTWTLAACMEAIHAAPSLLSIDFEIRGDDTHQKFSRITQNTLHRLSFACSHIAVSNAFFNALILPQLRSFFIKPSQVAAEPVIHMLERSRPPLETFTFRDSKWDAEAICTCLAQVKTLKTFSLYRKIQPSILVPPSNNRIFRMAFELLPSLEEFTYHNYYHPMEGWSFLKHIPACGSANRLKHVSVLMLTNERSDTGLLLDQSVMNWVQDLLKGGLRIVLHLGGLNLQYIDVINASAPTETDPLIKDCLQGRCLSQSKPQITEYRFPIKPRSYYAHPGYINRLVKHSTCNPSLVNPLEMDALADCVTPFAPLHQPEVPPSSDPLQNLPTELVSRIFELHEWSWPQGYLDSPLVLGAVCQLWRSIAWHTPSLWDVASFCLNPTTSLGRPSYDFAVRTELFKQYVERSGALPLTIYVYVNRSSAYEADDEQLRPLVDLINERSSQWRNITLELPASLWNSLSANRPIASPKLRTLRFSPTSNYSDENPAGELPLCFAQSLGDLKSLNLNRVNFDPTSVEGTWRNLQTLSVSSWTFDVCLEALRKAPSLHHATFTVRRDNNSPRTHQLEPNQEPQDFTINHDNLRNLTLNCRQALESDHFFDNLTLPALESLTLSGYPIAAPPIIRMIERSRPELRVFELANSSWKVEDLPSFLAVSKHLRTLTLNRPFFPFSPSILFRKLFEFGHLPKLEKLVYHDLWPNGGGWGFVEEIPNLADDKGERALRQIDVTLSTPKHTIDGLLPESSTLSWVDRLGKAGLEVGLCVKGPNVRSVDVMEVSLR